MKRAFQVAAAFAAATALVVVAPATATAHNYLVSSTPQQGEVLTSLPDQFVITTNDDLLDLGDGAGGFALQIIDSDGLYYGDGCVAVEGPSMTATAALGAPGQYTIVWQVVSIDGHTVSDQLTFTWQPDDISQSSAGSATPPECSVSNEPEEQPEAETPGEPTDAPAEPSESDDSAAEGFPTDLLWIGGAIIAVAIAAGATMVALGRRKG
jgi:methionine-rich copper-binding protein CopC